MSSEDGPANSEPAPWYRYCESFGVVISVVGVTLWGLAAKPGNSATLLGSTIAIAGLGMTLFLAGLAGHLAARPRHPKALQRTGDEVGSRP